MPYKYVCGCLYAIVNKNIQPTHADVSPLTHIHSHIRKHAHAGMNVLMVKTFFFSCIQLRFKQSLHGDTVGLAEIQLPAQTWRQIRQVFENRQVQRDDMPKRKTVLANRRRMCVIRDVLNHHL